MIIILKVILMIAIIIIIYSDQGLARNMLRTQEKVLLPFLK